MARKYKKNLISDHYLQDEQNVDIFISELERLIKQNKKVTKKLLKKETKFEGAELDALYEEYCEKKGKRIEMQCTALEKKTWQHKAHQAETTVSRLVAECLNSTQIYVPITTKYRDEINAVINERVRFNSLLNQTVRWCNTHKSGIETIQILIELKQLNEAFEKHDLEVMSIITQTNFC